ncbi:hypothetical protein PDE_03713 [Penicillium oxalicum 114-2]|uniref:Uncharacterized protein n=1 Tax=Penicillium oxalicum (strain 114-2 / CGMCC 5302) TaxID=933388 RepID=S8B2U1_PENO1|nr:hypothetical protein PDE_03713 [Penicillium oxalicum 114-2]
MTDACLDEVDSASALTAETGNHWWAPSLLATPPDRIFGSRDDARWRVQPWKAHPFWTRSFVREILMTISQIPILTNDQGSGSSEQGAALDFDQIPNITFDFTPFVTGKTLVVHHGHDCDPHACLFISPFSVYILRWC